VKDASTSVIKNLHIERVEAVVITAWCARK